VTNSKRIIIHPGEDSTLSMDRAERTKYVGIVAGYYIMQKENIVRLVEIPVGLRWFYSLFTFSQIYEPVELDIFLLLGPDQIKYSDTYEPEFTEDISEPLQQDMAPPEYKAPGYKTPEYEQPELKGPEYKPPEYKPPEQKPPELKGPEYKKPEYKPPEYKPPEIEGL
jgi:hypothetical protein